MTKKLTNGVRFRHVDPWNAYAFVVTTAAFWVCSCLAHGDSTVVFNEIMYHPQENEAELEWVELYNQMAVDMDISRWYVTGTMQFDFPEGTVVPGGGFLVVAASPGALSQATGFSDAYGPFTGSLENGAARLELRNNNDRVMDVVAYLNRGDWPVAPDGSGVSLAKIDPDGASRPAANWTWSERIGGTPGGRNFPVQGGPGVVTEGLVSYWSFDDAVIGTGESLEDFSEPDGFPVDWYPFKGDVSIESEELRLSADQSTEPYAWAGTSGSASFFSAIRSVTFRINFAGIPGDAIGRHGGTIICCSEPTDRYSPGMSGYTIDWIDRVDDHGYRIIRITNGQHTGLGNAGGPANPGAEWRIEFEASSFTLIVDGEERGTYPDASYRNGYVGMWCYQNPGQEVFYDDVRVEYTGSAVDAADGNHGTIGAGVSLIAGFVGDGALSFDNTSSAFVDVGSGTGDNFAVRTGITLEALIKPAWNGEVFEYDQIFRKEDGENRILFSFQHDPGTGAVRDVPLDPDQQPALAFGINVGGTYSELDMPLDGAGGRPALAELQDGDAHHVAATYDSASGTKAIYVDGALCFSASLGQGEVIASGGAARAIIGNTATFGEPFTGSIDEVAFWDRALSGDEVARHAANARDGDTYFVVPVVEEESGPALAFNEYLLSTEEDSWIEIVNGGMVSVQLDGCVLASTGAPGSAYVFPERMLAPGEYLTLTEPPLGFALSVGEKLFLYTADGTGVMAAVLLSEHHLARYPETTGRWLHPDQPTPGSGNSFAFTDAIVITEIMYHPMADDEELGEYVEIYNRGDALIDLSGFRFTDGILYEFPEGVTLESGGYLVVARDPDWLSATYEIAAAVGPYEGRLANGGERVALVDSVGNPVDEVTYYDGGRWPDYADGGGSSLELRDIGADNTQPEVWAASEEGAKSQWQEYGYSGVAAADGGPTQWNEFVLGLLAEGEVLLDDISVIESPQTEPKEFIQNGTFEGGAQAWRIIGTHRHSEVVTDPDAPGNSALRLVATGPTEHMHNHAETTLANGERVVNGRTYAVSFRAKWLGGSNLLNTRLYFSRVARATVLSIPERRGTPGAVNSVATDNVGPTYTAFQHHPAVPAPGQAVTASVFAGDPDGVATCVLWWAVNDGAWTEAGMTQLGDGRWRGTIPGHGSAQIVQFYVEAVDGRGAISMFPARGRDARALYKVEDGMAQLERLHNLRIIMTPSDTNLLHEVTNVMSNERLGATVIYDERDVFYDVGVRLKSSERGRLADSRIGFNLSFHPDRKFRGVHETVGIDRSGGIRFGRSFGQDEILVKHIINHAGGIPGMYDDLVYVIAPRNAQTSTALLLMARFNDVFLDSQWLGGGEGTLYTYELIYYPTTTVDGDPESLKLPQPDQVIGTDIRNLGDDKERYRWFFLIENNRARDDYSDLIRFCKTCDLTTTNRELENGAREVMDVDEWMRTFAMYSLCGISDTYTQGLDHNNMHYVRSTDDKVLVLPWDMDFAFVRSIDSPLWGNEAKNIVQIIKLPPYTRMFYRHLKHIIETTFNSTYMSSWVNHYGAMCDQDFRSITTYIRDRGNYVLSRLPASTPFAVTEVSGVDVTGPEVSVDAALAAFEGRAPFEVAWIEINGDRVEPRWDSLTRWSSLEFPLSPGPNVFEFVGRAHDAAELAAFTITVISTIDYDPPRVFLMLPTEGPSTGGTSVQVFGENFVEDSRVLFGSADALSVEFQSVSQLNAMTPPGTGQVTVTVENPDGLTGTGEDLFTYIAVESPFRRADANSDGEINIADAVTILSYLFTQGELTCIDAADVNDDGGLDIADAIALLSYAFGQGDPPGEPFAACGPDPTLDDLECAWFSLCR